VASPLHRGRLQQLWLVEIRDADERLVARGQVRLQNLESSERLGR
jgi:acyl-coenzyme A thioesterase PaaI-like protein